MFNLNRQFFLIFILSILFLVLFACPTNTKKEPDTTPTTVPNNPNKLTQVVIKLPKEITSSNESRAVGIIEAKNFTNYYEAVVAKKVSGSYTSYYTGSANKNDTSIMITLESAGTYDILLLAGFKDGSSTPLLLASGSEVGKIITLGIVNEINMKLDTFDVGIKSPDSVYTSSAFNVVVEINTRNPLISLNNKNIELVYTPDSGQSETLFKMGGILTGVNNLYSANFSNLVAPNAVTTGGLGLSDNNYRAFNATIGSEWNIFYYYGNDYIAGSERDRLSSYYYKEIYFEEIVGDGTKIKLNIDWIGTATLGMPAIVEANPIVSKTIKIRWVPIDGATSYFVYRLDATDKYRIIGKVPSTTSSFYDNGLEIGTYYYTVLAYNDTSREFSKQSSPVSATAENHYGVIEPSRFVFFPDDFDTTDPNIYVVIPKTMDEAPANLYVLSDVSVLTEIKNVNAPLANIENAVYPPMGSFVGHLGTLIMNKSSTNPVNGEAGDCFYIKVPVNLIARSAWYPNGLRLEFVNIPVPNNWNKRLSFLDLNGKNFKFFASMPYTLGEIRSELYVKDEFNSYTQIFLNFTNSGNYYKP